MTAVDVAIVGGGFTGAVFAIHLSRIAERQLDIAIVEPRDRPGRGVAYDTADPDHRLNAPLPVHFVYPDAPDHLSRWYIEKGCPARDPEARAADGNIYMRREEFGRYVEEQLRAHIDGNASGSRIRHIQSRALAARRTSDGYRLTLSDGRTLSARLTVLAASYDRPNVPPSFDGPFSGHAGFLPDPWDAARIREIPTAARILLLGTAQTASDVIAALLRSGHKGPITAVSRHGLRPRQRPAAASGPPPNVMERLARPVSLFATAHGRHATVVSLLRTLRSEARHAEAAGGAWSEPFGDLRDSVWELWPALPLVEKRRFLRHLRTWYDVHRFHLPPQIEAIIAEAEAAGQLSFEAAFCAPAARGDGVLSVALRRRGSGEHFRKKFDAIVNCTGPGLRPDRSTNPFLTTLVERGYAAPGRRRLPRRRRMSRDRRRRARGSALADRRPADLRRVRRPAGRGLHRAAPVSDHARHRRLVAALRRRRPAARAAARRSVNQASAHQRRKHDERTIRNRGCAFVPRNVSRRQRRGDHAFRAFVQAGLALHVLAFDLSSRSASLQRDRPVRNEAAGAEFDALAPRLENDPAPSRESPHRGMSIGGGIVPGPRGGRRRPESELFT